MNDKISALMDGELDDKSTAEMIDWLGRDGDALHAWRAYHLTSSCFSMIIELSSNAGRGKSSAFQLRRPPWRFCSACCLGWKLLDCPASVAGRSCLISKCVVAGAIATGRG